MATERITFDLLGLLTVDQVSQQVRASYKRTLKKVRISTLGVQPSGAAVTVKMRIAEAAQTTEYTLPAGLKSAENTAPDVEVAADSWTDFIVVATGSASDCKVEAEFEVAVTVGGGSTTDLGLGTLGELKRFVLNAGVVAETTYDEALTALGKGVAALINRHCNRTFARAASATDDFRGGTDLLLLSRFPVESITSIGLKTVGESAFTAQAGIIDTVALNSGVLCLVAETGTERDQLRVTYAGGYWYDTSDNGSGTMPDGATLLPHDVKLAWLLQCQHVWMSRDVIGVSYVQKDGSEGMKLAGGLKNAELIPQVKDMLEPFKRMML